MSLSPEQKAMRLTGISGSELAAVCGLSPWSGPVAVWEQKLGLHQEDLSLNPAVVRGTLLERPILQWYSMLSGRTVTQQTTLRHPKYPLIMATPDGIGVKENAEDVCVEVKCAGWRTAQHWSDPEEDPEGVPEYYLPQVQAQMAVTGLKKADVVLFAGEQPAIYSVAYDDALFEALREIAEKFWRDYVVTRKPPPPDSSKLYGEFLARHCPQAEDRVVLDLEHNEQAAFWANQLKLAKSQLKEIQAIEESAKNHIKALMAGYAHARLPGAQVTWKNQKPKRAIDWAAVCQVAHVDPELVKKHTAECKAPRPFRVQFEKEET